jgi:hypothetical protein
VLPAALMIGMLVLCAPRLALSLELDGFLKLCSSKTTVLGYDERNTLVKVGESLGGYCEGYLQGVLAALLQQGAICAREVNPSGEFLLSTVVTYRADTNARDNDAARVIGLAFRRAFICPS